MKRSWNIGYWFLLASLFIEAMLLGHMASTDYVLGRMFGFERAYPWSHWFRVLGGLLVCLLGFVAASSVLLHRPWSKQLAALFCSAAVVFISARALSADSWNWWLTSEFYLLPIAVLIYLACGWFGSRLNAHKVGQLS